MINFNLAGDALVHCLKISGAKVILVDEEDRVRSRAEGERRRIEELGMQTVVLSEDLKKSIAGKTAQRPDDSYREGLKGSFPSVLFYTR